MNLATRQHLAALARAGLREAEADCEDHRDLLALLQQWESGAVSGIVKRLDDPDPGRATGGFPLPDSDSPPWADTAVS